MIHFNMMKMNIVGYIFCIICQSLAVEIKFSTHQADITYNADVDSYIMLNNENGRRVRRDITPVGTVHLACKSAINEEVKKKIGKHTFPLKDSKHHDLTLLWLGDQKEVQILMTTTPHNFFVKTPTKLYKSTNGGLTFEPLEEKKLGNNAISSSHGINKSPIDNKRMILVAFEHTERSQILSMPLNRNANSTIIVTTDAAATFQTYTLPFKVRGQESFRFHPTKKDWILALESVTVFQSFPHRSTKKGTVWLSKDFGKTWKKLFPNEIVQDVKWGVTKGKEDHIFLLTQEIASFFMLVGFTTSTPTALYRSKDEGVSFQKIVESCKSFGIQGEFVFATVAFKENGSNVEKRVVHISHDNGDNFYPIHLPAVDTDQFYAVVEMHKGMVFLHLDEAGDTGKGTLYLSGLEGRMYTKSLDNHFYTNDGFTDFYRVESMEGVYLTQQLTAEKNLKSVITRDRGQTWQPIKIDREKYCKIPMHPGKYKNDCTLHYHHVFSKAQRTLIGSLVQSPISVSNAPGLILLHGQAGDALTGVMDVWMSKNGGYDWTMVANGPHHYAIGDGGNLIVLVPKFNASGTTLKYSIDQGRCWHDYHFAEDSEPLHVYGLATEPHSEERSFSLWGFSKNASDAEQVWVVVTVDFRNMFEKKCEANQFENWYPHTANRKGGCFLGVKKIYQRPKEDAVCYLGKGFKPVVSTTKCKCNKDDLQCDYGYDRLTNGTCKRNRNYTLMICKDGYEETESFSKGYRLISGDDCDEKEAVEDKVKYINTKKECKEDEMIGIVKEELAEKKWKQELAEKERKQQQKKREEELKLQQQKLKLQQQDAIKKQQQMDSKKKHSSKFLVAILVMVIMGVGIGAVWFGRRSWRLRNRTQFVMSRLHDEIDDDENEVKGAVNNDAFDPTPASKRPYKDESDWDDEELLPV